MAKYSAKQNDYLSQQFTDLNLSGREIVKTEFDDCTFSDCDFSESIFESCKFIECHFHQCNLSLAQLEQSRFNDVIFDQCKLVGVDWTKAAWPKFSLPSPIKFYKCIINDCSFFGLDLQEIVIEESKAHDADFREGDFGEANFTYTDFSNALFNSTNLSSVDFTEATNYNIDIQYNRIKKAKFSRYEAVRLLDCLEVELVD